MVVYGFDSEVISNQYDRKSNQNQVVYTYQNTIVELE